LQRADRDGLVVPADRAAEYDRRRRREITPQALEGRRELPLPRLRDRIVERDDESRLRRRVETALDHRPRFQIIGQRQRAEIVAERCPDTRGHRQHRCNAGHDLHVERTPSGRTRFDLLANRRRHREYAGIAAAHQGDLATGRRPVQRGACPQCFLTVVRGMPALAFTNRRAVEVRSVTEQRIGGGQGGIRLRREPAGIARAKPDHRERAAHRRPSQPGTSTTAK
jgi:hypothetical protein